jgi:hypothetical protein
VIIEPSEQVQAVLALQALADDLHVEHAEEAATVPESERDRALWLVEEGGVVETQPLKRLAQEGVVVIGGWVQAGEHHRLGRSVPWQRLSSWRGGKGDRVADLELADVLQAGRDVADLARVQALVHHHAWREDANFEHVGLLIVGHHLDALAAADRAIDDADVRDHALVRIVMRVKHERAERRVVVALRRGHPLHDRFEDVLDAEARFG